MVYPDAFRSVAPLVLSSRIDRGWALERAWLKHLGVSFDRSPSLGTWREDARNHVRPAVIFNTTVVESGERFLFPTVDVSSSPGRRSFHDVDGYQSLDLSAVTAARLSASFTYVTPVARAQCCPPRPHRYHFADGGYYDNYGLASLSELLDQATEAPAAVRHILLIQILLDQPESDPRSEGSRGWFFQSFAPLETLYKMRSAAQYSRDETEYALLKQALHARGVQLDRVKFSYQIPKIPCQNTPTPLSWHLTQGQISCVKDTWNAYGRRPEISTVMAFVRSPQTFIRSPELKWAVVAVVLTASSTAWFRLPPPDALPRCLDTVLVAFQTARSPGEAQFVWNLLSDRQKSNLANAQYPDFAFIAAYTFLFLVLAAIGRARPIRSSQIAGRIIVISAFITAVADVGENCFTLMNIAALKLGLPDAARIDLMRHFSLTKWAASGLTLILLGWVFLPSRRGSALYRFLALSVTAFSVTSGTMGVLGMWDITKIDLVFPFLTPALVLQIPLFIWYWDDLRGDHAPIVSQPIEKWEVSVSA
jgi:hypothetical protein